MAVALGAHRGLVAGRIRGHDPPRCPMLAVGVPMFVPHRTMHLLSSSPRRARRYASVRARASLAAAQPGVTRTRRFARAALLVGALAIVLSLVPGWLGYQPLEDASGGLALVSVAGAASEVGPADPALVVPVPHLASVVEATSSMPGRVTLLTLPLLVLLATSLLRRAGRHWPADRVVALPRSQPAVHAASFPRGPAPAFPTELEAPEERVTPPRASVALLGLIAAAVAVAGVLGRRGASRG
ncbi:MAG: hypothetical protein R3C39_09750 [Dehalococcoidia bacterium]